MKPASDVRAPRGAALAPYTTTLAVVGLLSFAAACRTVSLPEPTTVPAAAGVAGGEPGVGASAEVASIPAGPWLSVSAPRATFRAPGSAPSGELAVGETRELVVGSAVDLLDCGRAKLHWSDAPDVAVEGGAGMAADALAGEMVRGAAEVVDGVDLEARLMALTQETGTVRYVLADVEHPVAITVTVAALVVSPRGSADVIVSWAPYPAPATAPTTAEPAAVPAAEERGVAAGDEAGAEGVWVIVVEGEAQIEMAVDVDGEAALSGDAAGDATGDAVPTVVGAGEAVALDVAGQVIGREVLPVADIEDWFAAAAACAGTGPVVDLDAVKPATATAAAAATATAAAAATATAAARAAGGRTQASLTADRAVLVAGKCTLIRWQATNALIVSLDGNDVNHSGSREVCPGETTTYTLRWVHLTGSSDETTVTITVNPTPGQAERRQDEEERPTAGPHSRRADRDVCPVRPAADDRAGDSGAAPDITAAANVGARADFGADADPTNGCPNLCAEPDRAPANRAAGADAVGRYWPLARQGKYTGLPGRGSVGVGDGPGVGLSVALGVGVIVGIGVRVGTAPSAATTAWSMSYCVAPVSGR